MLTPFASDSCPALFCSWKVSSPQVPVAAVNASEEMGSYIVPDAKIEITLQITLPYQ